MRLKRLTLPDFKNLAYFEIEFSSSLATVLVGPNGTGKSNLLEALVLIFRDLDLGHLPQFSYEIEYECRGANVAIKIDLDQPKRAQVSILVDGKSWSLDKFSRKGGGQHLPGFVFGYYSGPSNRMEQHFEQHQRQFSTELLNGVDQPLRPLLYARQVHSQFVLLSFFAAAGSVPEVLRRFLRIEGLDSVLFVLKRPDWYNAQRRGGDPRFWGARGVVRDFASRIYDAALGPLRLAKPRDNLFLYLQSQDEVTALSANYANQAEFFKALESLYISDLVEDVRTRVRVSGYDKSLTFRELSEGEQQLLTVLGLLKFIEGSEGLILLDEPDTHLNPAWSMEYISLLREHVADQETTQIVMCTHDPLVFRDSDVLTSHCCRQAF